MQTTHCWEAIYITSSPTWHLLLRLSEGLVVCKLRDSSGIMGCLFALRCLLQVGGAVAAETSVWGTGQ